MAQAQVQDLINQVAIVDLIANFSSLTKAGSTYKTICPNHGDNSPSLSINSSKQIYKCFVCDHGGNALDYLIWAQKFSYPQAITYLANFSGLNPSDYLDQNQNDQANKDPIITKYLEAMKLIHNTCAYNLDLYTQSDQNLKQYLTTRGLTNNLITHFEIGYLDQNAYQILTKRIDQATLMNLGLINENGRPIYHKRLIFPIKDPQGNPIAISGRTLEQVSDQNVKYLHSKASRIFQKDHSLYHYDQAKTNQTLYLCEGFMDVVGLKRCGYNNGVALMGLDLGLNRLKLLNHHDLIICFDQDQAGKQAAFNLVQKLIATNPLIKVVSFNDPQAKDIDELSLKNPTLAKQVLDQPLDGVAFSYQFCFQNLDWNNPQLVKNALNQFQSVIAHDPTLVQIYQQRLMQDYHFQYQFLFQPTQSATKTKPHINLTGADLVLLSCFQNPDWIDQPQIYQALIAYPWNDVQKWKIIKALILKQPLNPTQIKSFLDLIKNHRHQLHPDPQSLLKALTIPKSVPNSIKTL